MFKKAGRQTVITVLPKKLLKQRVNEHINKFKTLIVIKKSLRN